MRQALANLVKKMPGVGRLLRRAVRLGEGRDGGDYPVHVYSDHIPCEIPVQLGLRDFVRPGDCVLDVGANIGGISIASSRLVGSAGRVHAFEANPSLLPKLNAQLEANGVSNVTVVGKAAWHTSGKKLQFHIDDGYNSAASSLMHSLKSGRSITVRTVSLDDYCRRHRLAPAAIKLDVEGAEGAVLAGAKHTIGRNQPVIIFEYYPSRENDPTVLLQSLGYVLYDVNNYARVDRDYYLKNFDPVPMSNVLAVPAGLAVEWSVSIGPPSAMDIKPGKRRSEAWELSEAGRYLIATRIEGPEATTAQLMVTSTGRKRLACYMAPIGHLKLHGCSNLVIEVDRPTRIVCGIECDDPSRDIVLHEATISRVCTGRRPKAAAS